QLEKLREAWEEQRSPYFQEEQALKPDARRKRSYELAKTQESALASILQDKLARLKQIDLQLQGPRAFQQSYAVRVLKLSPEQRQEIRDFSEQTMARMHAEDFGLDPDKKRALREQIQREEVERILGIMTQEQSKRWQALIGEPFKRRPGGKGPR